MTLSSAIDYFLSKISVVDGELFYTGEKLYVNAAFDVEYTSLMLGSAEISEYSIIVPSAANSGITSFATDLRDHIRRTTGYDLPIKTDDSEPSSREILIGNTSRTSADESSNKDSYRLHFDDDGSSGRLAVIFGSNTASLAKNDLFERIGNESFTDGTRHRGGISEESMIVTSIPYLRDPAVILVDGVYYTYGTRWICYRNTSGDLDGEWEDLGVVANIPEDAETNYWAPEVHIYNGKYYMFTTYKSKSTGHRGCVIMRSDRPEGPFEMITDGHITPKDWDSIDGTFYIDEEGQPWMVFVHEWTSMEDGVGRMAAAKLSDDLTRFISEPIELFKATDPTWAAAKITDGCWMYKCSTGELLMLWSNSDAHGYCVGIARSDNGKIDGKWTQDDQVLYSGSMGQYDGGHGMIFVSDRGQMYLSIHSPNSSSAGRSETPVFIEIVERDGTLVWADPPKK